MSYTLARYGVTREQPTFAGVDDLTATELYQPDRTVDYGTVADVYVATDGNDAWTGTAPAFVSGTVGPKRTMVGAVAAAPAGGKIKYRGGRYRVTATAVPGAGKPLTHQPYGNETAVHDGAAVLPLWTPEGALWWSVFVSPLRPHADATMVAASGTNNGNFPTNPNNKYYVGVFWDGAPIAECVANQAAVVPGKVWHDYTRGRLYVADNPAGHTVEASVVRRILTNQAAGTVVEGMVFCRAGGEYQAVGANGIMNLSGNNSVIRNCTVAFATAFGLEVGGAGNTSTIVEDSHFYYNGAMDVCGAGGATQIWSGLVVQRNYFKEANKWHGYRIDWATGAVKLLSGSQMVMADNYVYYPKGGGMWFDYSCFDSWIVGNYVEGAAFAALDSEMSKSVYVLSNVVVRSYIGLICQGSNTDFYVNNTFVDCFDAFKAIDDSRTINPANDPDAITGNTGTLTLQNNLFVARNRPIPVAGNLFPRAFINTDDFNATGTQSAATWFSAASLNHNMYVREPGLVMNGSNREVYWENGASVVSYADVPAFVAATGRDANAAYLVKPAFAVLQDVDRANFARVPNAVAAGALHSATTMARIGPTVGISTVTAPLRGAYRHVGRVVRNANNGNGAWDTFVRGDSATSPGTSTSGHLWTESNGNGGISTNRLYFPDDVNQNKLSMLAAGTSFVNGVLHYSFEGHVSSATDIRVPALAIRLDATNEIYVYFHGGTVRLSKLDANLFGAVTTAAMPATVPSTDGRVYCGRLIKRGNLLAFDVDGIRVLTHTLVGANTKYNVGGNLMFRLIKAGAPTQPAFIHGMSVWADPG